jgi:hypothetical protein
LPYLYLIGKTFNVAKTSLKMTLAFLTFLKGVFQPKWRALNIGSVAKDVRYFCLPAHSDAESLMRTYITIKTSAGKPKLIVMDS